jgi:multiple sugar transport system ATP-binding protein
VRRNIEFPLKSRHVDKSEREGLVHDAAESLDLGDLLDRKPGQLSGGQRQRVALARAIVRRPLAFLMDEPLSNLDAKLRVQTRAELVELQRRLEATIIYVTHDQVEAMTMGDRIAILNDGRLQQVAPPQDVYLAPANLFVARFIGNPPMNTVPASVVTSNGSTSVQLPACTLPVPAELAAAIERAHPEAVIIGVRPEHLELDPAGAVPATVTVIESLGHERHVICRLEDSTMIIVRQAADVAPPTEGEQVRLSAAPEHLHVFDASTEARIDGSDA